MLKNQHKSMFLTNFELYIHIFNIFVLELPKVVLES